MEDVDKKLEEFIKSGNYKDVLIMIGNLGKYSLTNQIYILLQKPDAVTVNGMRGWNFLGRSIEKDEKAIKIMAPIRELVDQEVLDENGNKDSHRLNFVFKSELSHRDFIGKFDVSKAVRIGEFDCDYDHCIFEKGPSGERRKVLLKKVHIVISVNIGGYENEDRIQID